jgi:MFS family permease
MKNEFFKQIKELRKFLILWGSQSLSSLGSSMTAYALLIWVYEQSHSALGVSLLAVCTYLPSILLSFFAGAFVDRHNKKKIILVCDSVSILCTTVVILLVSQGMLQVWHIYLINMLGSTMAAFQTPANTVVISGIVPQKHYMKIGGLQSISGSVIGILTPALATALITFFGLPLVFIVDIATFLFAFITLLFFIDIPKALHPTMNTEQKSSYLMDCKEGFLFLKNHSALLKLILYFTAINTVAYIGGGGITTTVAAMILSRVSNGKVILGYFSTAVALGTLLGGIIVTFMNQPKSKVAVIFLSCSVSFFICDLSLGLFHNPVVWIVANFIGNLPLALLNANMSVIMRTRVPLQLQGRVFSARDTLQYCTIPLGYLFGGVLADYIFEPMMQANTFLQDIFAPLVGMGDGSGIAVMFLFTGITGTIISISGLFDKKMRTLDDNNYNL